MAIGTNHWDVETFENKSEKISFGIALQFNDMIWIIETIEDLNYSFHNLTLSADQ